MLKKRWNGRQLRSLSVYYYYYYYYYYTSLTCALDRTACFMLDLEKAADNAFIASFPS